LSIGINVSFGGKGGLIDKKRDKSHCQAQKYNKSLRRRNDSKYFFDHISYPY